MSAVTSVPQYRFNGELLKYNTYGDRVERKYSVSILASTMSEAVDKARAMANATYDDFRKFWSHGLRVDSIVEVVEQVPADSSNGDDHG